MKIEQVTREFNYNGTKLVDPSPRFTPEEVQRFYSASYPEITSATIEGPETKGNKLVYNFRRSVGTKG